MPLPNSAFMEIPLTRGMVAYCSPDDWPRLSRHRWHVHIQRHTSYACRSIRMPTGRSGHLSMHRDVMQAPPDRLVDHKDQNGLNNTRENLRLATGAENQRNAHGRGVHRGKPSSSKYRGVSRSGEGKWAVHISMQGRNIRLGTYRDEEHAARVYDEAAKKYHGQFARLNFPEG
jgi:hypothetical protein